MLLSLFLQKLTKKQLEEIQNQKFQQKCQEECVITKAIIRSIRSILSSTDLINVSSVIDSDSSFFKIEIVTSPGLGEKTCTSLMAELALRA